MEAAKVKIQRCFGTPGQIYFVRSNFGYLPELKALVEPSSVSFSGGELSLLKRVFVALSSDSYTPYEGRARPS